MGLHTSRYEQIRDQVRPGDVIAFAGSHLFSRLISLAMDYPVSHIGIVAAAADRGSGPMLVQAVMYQRFGQAQRGVHRAALDDIVPRCRSNVWWLPLHSDAVRDATALDTYLRGVLGTRFDTTGALRAVLSELCERWLGVDLSEFDGGPDELYCAELVVTALMQAGALPPGDPSDASPRDVCRWSLYADCYHHIGTAPAAEVPGFNSIRPGSHSRAWHDQEAFTIGAHRLADELRTSGDAGAAARVETAVKRLT